MVMRQCNTQYTHSFTSLQLVGSVYTQYDVMDEVTHYYLLKESSHHCAKAGSVTRIIKLVSLHLGMWQMCNNINSLKMTNLPI